MNRVQALQDDYEEANSMLHDVLDMVDEARTTAKSEAYNAIDGLGGAIGDALHSIEQDKWYEAERQIARILTGVRSAARHAHLWSTLHGIEVTP